MYWKDLGFRGWVLGSQISCLFTSFKAFSLESKVEIEVLFIAEERKTQSRISYIVFISMWFFQGITHF